MWLLHDLLHGAFMNVSPAALFRLLLDVSGLPGCRCECCSVIFLILLFLSVSSAALGTLEFELRYDMSCSELHCTVLRAKVRNRCIAPVDAGS